MECVLRGEECGKEMLWPRAPARLEGKGKEEKKQGCWSRVPGVSHFGGWHG
jgi:hypothetical protein